MSCVREAGYLNHQHKVSLSALPLPLKGYLIKSSKDEDEDEGREKGSLKQFFAARKKGDRDECVVVKEKPEGARKKASLCDICQIFGER